MMRAVGKKAVPVLLVLAIGCNQNTEPQGFFSADGNEAIETLSENESAPASSTSETSPDAEQILANALSTATIESKYVLVHVGAPWCGWCLVLEEFLDTNKDLFEENYIVVKIDTVTMLNGQVVSDRLREERVGGFPWMVILDADGIELISSDSSGGNIGYPIMPNHIEYFMMMIEKTNRHSSQDQLNRIAAALELNAKRIAFQNPRLKVYGKEQYSLKFSRPLVRFKETMMVGQPSDREDVDIISTVPLQSLKARGCEEIAVLSVSKITDLEYKLSIQLRKDIIRSKPFRDQVRLIVQIKPGEEIQLDGPILVGRILSEVEASPAQFRLGFVKVGSTIRLAFAIRSLNGKAFNVVSYNTEPVEAQASVKATTSDTNLFELVHEVTSVGMQKMNVSVDVETEGGGRHRVNVPIHYVGVDRQL